MKNRRQSTKGTCFLPGGDPTPAFQPCSLPLCGCPAEKELPVAKPEPSASYLSPSVPHPWAKGKLSKSSVATVALLSPAGDMEAPRTMGQSPTVQNRGQICRRVGSCLAVVIQMFTDSSSIHSRLLMIYEHWGYSHDKEDMDHALTESSKVGDRL